MNKVIFGINALATTHPELAAEWHPTKNGDLTPKDVSAISRKVVWWQCTNGHEWRAEIKSRAQGMGCPFDMEKNVKSKTENNE